MFYTQCRKIQKNMNAMRTMLWNTQQQSSGGLGALATPVISWNGFDGPGPLATPTANASTAGTCGMQAWHATLPPHGQANAVVQLRHARAAGMAWHAMSMMTSCGESRNGAAQDEATLFCSSTCHSIASCVTSGVPSFPHKHALMSSELRAPRELQ